MILLGDEFADVELSKQRTQSNLSKHQQKRAQLRSPDAVRQTVF
jgi:hypothetical protein